jgi:hypothetical protein
MENKAEVVMAVNFWMLEVVKVNLGAEQNTLIHKGRKKSLEIYVLFL